VAPAKGLTGGGALRHSCVWDLAIAAQGARGEDGEPYPSWHKVAEGHRWLGNNERRRRLGELGGGAFGGEEKGKGSGFELGGGETEAGAPLYRAARRGRGGEAVTGGNGVSMLRPFRVMGGRAPVSRVKGERRR
jgi:hypothetical protein